MAGCPPGLSDVPEGQPGRRPGLFPGTPGHPSRRAGSQRAAQQETLPLRERPVHAGGPVRPAPHPGTGVAASTGTTGVPLHDAPPGRLTEPPRPEGPLLLSPRTLGPSLWRRPQLVVSSVSSSIFQSPSTLTSPTWTVCVQDWAPSVVTWHSEPSGAGCSPEFA